MNIETVMNGITRQNGKKLEGKTAHEENRRALREKKAIPCVTEFAHARRPPPPRARARELFNRLVQNMGERAARRWLEDMLNLSLGWTLSSLDDQAIDDFNDEAERFLDGADGIAFEWWSIVAGPSGPKRSGAEPGG